MSDETTDESNAKGKEDIVDTKKPEEPDKVNNEISPLDRAEAANKEKEKLLEREEKLQDRKEKMFAEEKVGGRAKVGGEVETKEETPKEYNARIEKEISEGKHND